MKLKATTISVAIHPENESPIFGDDVIHVCMDDEAAGKFIVLKQLRMDTNQNEIKVELEELEMILEIARGMINGRAS